MQLARDVKALRVEYANEPAATTSTSTRMALSVSLISDISYVL